MGVEELQPLNQLDRNEIGEQVEGLDSLQAAELPESVVSWQTVISPSLDVEGHEVHAEAFALAYKVDVIVI